MSPLFLGFSITRLPMREMTRESFYEWLDEARDKNNFQIHDPLATMMKPLISGTSKSADDSMADKDNLLKSGNKKGPDH